MGCETTNSSKQGCASGASSQRGLEPALSAPSLPSHSQPPCRAQRSMLGSRGGPDGVPHAAQGMAAGGNIAGIHPAVRMAATMALVGCLQMRKSKRTAAHRLNSLKVSVSVTRPHHQPLDYRMVHAGNCLAVPGSPERFARKVHAACQVGACTAGRAVLSCWSQLATCTAYAPPAHHSCAPRQH